MATAKYNWELIKQKYLESDLIEIQDFLRTYLRLEKPISAFFKSKTVGWREEKEKFQKDITQRAVEKNIELKSDELLIPIEKLQKLKVDIINIVSERLLNHRHMLSAKELKAMWEISKVELGEPTSVSKTENLNTETHKEAEIEAMNKLAKAIANGT